MKNRITTLIVFFLSIIGLELFLRAHKTVTPVKAIVVVDKTSVSYNLCSLALSSMFSKIKTEVTEVSELAPKCKKITGECKELGTKSKKLIEDLTGSDMNLRWQDFSCSPIMFVKLKQMAKAADGLTFLSILKHKTTDLDRQAREILEPLRFMESDREKITEDCCPRPT